MRLKHSQNLLARQRLFQIIDCAQLHGLQVNIHAVMPRHNNNRPAAVCGDRALQHHARPKSRPSLVQHDCVEGFAVQTTRSLDKGRASPHLKPVVMEELAVAVKIVGPFVDQKDKGPAPCSAK